MAINPKIKQKAEDIRSKIFGSEVRESLASGIEAISEDVEATIGRQGYVEEQFQDVLDETTGKDVINGPEIIAARNGELNLKTRLDKEKQEVTAQLQQTEQELNSKANDVDVRKKQNLITLNDLDGETLGIIQNGSGGAPINIESVPKDRSVDENKTTFFKQSNNLFDKNRVFLNNSISSVGALLDSTGFVTSDFIPVTALEKIIIKNCRGYAYYKADKTFVDNSRFLVADNYNSIIAENPIGVNFMRFYWKLSDESIEEQQVNVGELLLPYQRHWLIEEDHISKRKTTRDDLSFYVPEALPSKNRHKPISEIKGFYINQANGELLANEPHSTFEIDVTPNETITFSSHNRSHFYKNGVPLYGTGLLDSKVNEPLTRVVPHDADTMKYSFYYETMVENFQIESGTASTSYAEPGFTMPDLLLPESDTVTDFLPDVNLPSKIYATVGEELTIYNQNIMKDKESEFNIDWDCSIGKQMSDRYTVTPSTTGNVSLTFNLYRKSEKIATKSTTLVVSNKRTTPKKVIEVGDSTSIAAGFAYAVKRMKDKLGDNVVLLGTQGTSPILYEGRGGWKAETYRTNTLYYDVVNPFYNPATQDFDFTYYMVQNGFSNVDVVILNLGINDVFGSKDDTGALAGAAYSMTHTDFLISSILAYDSTIKIALNIAIPPNADQDVFGNIPDVALFQTQWRAKYNNFIYAEKLIEHYQDKHDLIPIHAVIDTVNNIDDHVHPTENGYYQIGDQKYNYLNSL